MEYTVKQIAKLLNGTVDGDGDVKIKTVAKIEEGYPSALTFLANPKYTNYIYTTKASAVIINKDFKPEKEIAAALIRVDDAYSAFAELLNVYNRRKYDVSGISKKAKIHKTAKIGKNVFIGDFVSIGEHVTIGDNTKIHANVTIYPHVTIKNNCLIYAGVVITDTCQIGNDCIILPNAVIGSDGFGFAPGKDGKYKKIPQTGNVVLEDNVEVGSNATIDRATMGSTYIRKGTKVDNLIQIGHNCDIGSNTVIAGQSGISGSTKVGENCMIGGQVGVAGHLKIGNNVMLAAKSGVMGNIKDDSMEMGAPSFDARKYKKAYVYFMNLDKLTQRINQLEKELKDIKEVK